MIKTMKVSELERLIASSPRNIPAYVCMKNTTYKWTGIGWAEHSPHPDAVMLIEDTLMEENTELNLSLEQAKKWVDKIFPNPMMMCPKCQTSIVPREQARVQSLSEHVCDPNGEPYLKQLYGCLNKNCACFKDKIRWTEDGERFGGKYDVDYKFIDDNDAPFGTIFRKINAERQSRLVFELNLYFIKWRILELFKANEWGKIVDSKYWKLETFVRQKHGYYTYHKSGIHMLIYCIGKINQYCKSIKEAPDEPFFREKLKEETEFKSWWPKTAWWRWVAMWYARYRRLYEKI